MSEERKPIQVMLTEEQRAVFDRAAERQGVGTSTWMRQVALEAARASGVLPDPLPLSPQQSEAR